jgi:hypothetical protein
MRSGGHEVDFVAACHFGIRITSPNANVRTFHKGIAGLWKAARWFAMSFIVWRVETAVFIM